jgi:hypothetical protein
VTLIAVEPAVDAPPFIARVDAIFSGSIRGLNLPCIWVVRIDNFFDDRWFQFAGKVLGAVRLVRSDPLHVPPFHPHRVVSEHCFVRERDTYVAATAPRRLHIAQHSEANEKKERQLKRFGERAAFLWYSSASLTNGNASAMSYVIDGEDVRAWYATFGASNGWRPLHTVATDAGELRDSGAHSGARVTHGHEAGAPSTRPKESD